MLGRSRDGLTTRVHLACDGRGLPLAVLVTPGDVNDSTAFDAVLNAVRVPRTGGRPPAFDHDLCKARNVVERCFNRLKQFRTIATRFDKPATRCRAGLHLAALILWLREPGRDRLSDRAPSGGRCPASSDLCMERNTVERLINKLKAWRGVASRHDRTPESYLAGLHLRASMIRVNDLLQAPGYD